MLTEKSSVFNVSFPLPFFFDIEGSGMKKINVIGFYQMGNWLGYLREMRPRTSFEKALPYLTGAKNWLEVVCGTNEGEIVQLQLCKPAAQSLLDAVKIVLNRIFTTGLAGEVTDDESRNININLTRFETVLVEELGSLATYYVSQKSIYSTPFLIGKAENAFSEPVRSRLSEQCIRDIKEAGKCIAFELPTAAGFHAFRSLESVVLDYLDRLGKKPPKPYDRNLGKYINFLEENKADEKALSVLRQLKDLHRNPLFHPTDNLEIGEDIGVFNLVTTAIAALVKDMEKRNLFLS